MRIRILNLLLVVLLVSGGFYSCKKTTSQIQRDQEVELLQAYVKKYLPGIKPTTSGLYLKEITPGTNTTDSIKAGDIVQVYYTGHLIENNDSLGITTGTQFDSTSDPNHPGNYEPFTFTVGSNSVISGWNEAIRLMFEGEAAQWVLPSRLAYSGQSQSLIPPYSPLVFDVTVVKVYHPGTYIPPVVSRKQPLYFNH